MWTKMSLPNSQSPVMEQLLFFHDHTMMMAILILSSSMMMMNLISINSITNKKFTEQQLTETIWTIMPSIILILIAIPSIKNLYLMEEISKPSLSIKTIGHQWYWSYEYTDKSQNEIESYMKKNSTRLIDTDNRLILPFKTNMRMLISSTDVLHSWTIPSLGIKMDAVPGRLNQTKMFMKNPGLMYGQCSEICGTNHSFMPITIESTSMKNFIKWMMK